MTETLPLPRLHAPLAATLLALALTAVAWSGAAEEPSGEARPQTRPSDKLPEMRPPGDIPPQTGPSDAFDSDDPTTANLSPELLEAVQAAARDARADGVPMIVTSGWRSREQQQRLFDEAVDEYGSEEEALQYAVERRRPVG